MKRPEPTYDELVAKDGPPRTVKARDPEDWPLPELLVHVEGAIADVATGTLLDDRAAILAFLSRRRRCETLFVTMAPADLVELVLEAGGKVAGGMSERRPMLVTGKTAERPTEEGRIRYVKLDRADRRSLVVDGSAISDDFPAVIGVRDGDGPAAVLAKLTRWGLDYLDWCRQIGERPRGSRGSWGARFLRHPAFFPAARRKVPKVFNETVRPMLPGNHYELRDDAGPHPRVAEIDQTSAHHQAAGRIEFGDPDDLVACGHWRTGGEEVYCGPADEPVFSRVLARYGVLRLRLRCRATEPGEITWPWWPAGGGEITADIFTTELADVLSVGAEIVGIVGALVSKTLAPALNRYGEWAQGQIGGASEYRRRWLKPILLSTYGVLAQAPARPATFSSSPTEHSRPEPIVLAGRLVEMHVARGRLAIEPQYVNVIDRGQIEAETRAETMRKARQIDRETGGRGRVIALYADSVLFRIEHANGELFRDGGHAEAWMIRHLDEIGPVGQWRVKAEHTNLQFLVDGSATHWESLEASKRPGVPKARRGAGGRHWLDDP